MAEPQATFSPKLFLPSKRCGLVLTVLGLAALGLALFLRYGIIQNTPVGLACEAGEESFTCTMRLAVILLFVRSAFGWTALIAATVQLVRPNRIAFGIGRHLAQACRAFDLSAPSAAGARAHARPTGERRHRHRALTGVNPD